MSRIRGVSIEEFQKLIVKARTYHSISNEPIPEISLEKLHHLESCLNTPFQKFAGQYLYKGFIGKAAILFYLLVKNHPLANGNKRMAIFTLIYFCEKNNRHFRWKPELLYDLPKRIATSDSQDMDSELRFIAKTLKSIQKK